MTSSQRTRKQQKQSSISVSSLLVLVLPLEMLVIPSFVSEPSKVQDFLGSSPTVVARIRASVSFISSRVTQRVDLRSRAVIGSSRRSSLFVEKSSIPNKLASIRSSEMEKSKILSLPWVLLYQSHSIIHDFDIIVLSS